MSLTKYSLGVKNFLVALLKGYDYEVRSNSLQLPILAEWLDRDPYAPFLKSVDRFVDDRVMAALVFVQGREKGDVQYLFQGQQTLGIAAHSDITIFSEKARERQLVLDVEPDGVRMATSHPDTPFEINGQAAQQSFLVDQDEVRYMDCSFYYVWLGDRQ